MEPKAQPLPMQEAANPKLGLRVTFADGGHDSAACFNLHGVLS
jgi:hypothetical protein